MLQYSIHTIKTSYNKMYRISDVKSISPLDQNCMKKYYKYEYKQKHRCAVQTLQAESKMSP